MSWFFHSESIRKEVRLLTERWYRTNLLQNDQGKLPVPIAIVNLIYAFYRLQDHFKMCLPEMFITSPITDSHRTCTISSGNLENPNAAQPPWFRIFGNFNFGSIEEENLHSIVWKLQYRVNHDWVWLTLGIRDPRFDYQRDNGPSATICGSIRSKIYNLYGNLGGRVRKVYDWTIEEPIYLLAEIRKAAETKVFVYVILGKQKISIGGTLVQDLEQYQFVMHADCGHQFEHQSTILQTLKLLQFRVNHGCSV